MEKYMSNQQTDETTRTTQDAALNVLRVAGVSFLVVSAALIRYMGVALNWLTERLEGLVNKYGDDYDNVIVRNLRKWRCYPYSKDVIYFNPISVPDSFVDGTESSMDRDTTTEEES